MGANEATADVLAVVRSHLGAPNSPNQRRHLQQLELDVAKVLQKHFPAPGNWRGPMPSTLKAWDGEKP